MNHLLDKATVLNVAKQAMLQLNRQWRLDSNTACVPFQVRDVATCKAFEEVYADEFGPADGSVVRSVLRVELNVNTQSPARPFNDPANFALITHVHYNGTVLAPDTPVQMIVNLITQQSRFRAFMKCTLDAGRGRDFREEHCLCQA
jgi:hypothetical protein